MSRRYYTPWKKLSKEERKRAVIYNIALLVAFAGVILTYVFSTQIFGTAEEGGIFDRTFEPEFVCQIYRHIPALIATVQIVVWALIIAKLIRFFSGILFSRTRKTLTISYMVSSMLKWVVYIVAFLLILASWGVDTTTIIASAGVLTLVIGLGAQSLITDIIAGVFLIAEEVFEIGDIIVFDGFRGTVRSIGIRTTEIEDAGGDIKYINNSELKQVINKSKKLSVAKSYIQIEYQQSIPEAEKIISENLAKYTKGIVGVESPVTYMGVSELGSSGITLFFLCKCKEKDVFQVTRDMNRALKIMFDENGLNVPFPQIVLHNGD